MSSSKSSGGNVVSFDSTAIHSLHQRIVKCICTTQLIMTDRKRRDTLANVIFHIRLVMSSITAAKTAFFKFLGFKVLRYVMFSNQYFLGIVQCLTKAFETQGRLLSLFFLLCMTVSAKCVSPSHVVCQKYSRLKYCNTSFVFTVKLIRVSLSKRG